MESVVHRVQWLSAVYNVAAFCNDCDIVTQRTAAYSIWNGIYIRCYKNDNVYDGSYMCDLWRHDKDSFAEWRSYEYYECDSGSMAVDKDLLFPGNKEYAPDKCCIIPQSLNTLCCQTARSIGRENGRMQRWMIRELHHETIALHVCFLYGILNT